MSDSKTKRARKPKTVIVRVKPSSIVDVVHVAGKRITHAQPARVSPAEAKDLVSRSQVLEIAKG